MECNSIGVKLPVIDDRICIECGSCERICTVLNPPRTENPKEAFAAWNRDPLQRRTSASGGIAAALYRYAIENDSVVIGASQNSDWSVTHKIADKVTELAQFKNSRYVFSEPYNIYGKVKQLLKDGRKILMIGLPCQIAAMKKIFPDNNKLTLIDIVCHGIIPASYLQQHISVLEFALNQKAERMSFRAPEKGTSNYFFTLYDRNDKIIYSKRSADGDVYNIAFHRSIAYRENCYHCQYARRERVSDLTIGDYHGLGSITPTEYDATDVSVILVNTQKGKELIEQITKQGLIHIDKRPIEEPIEGDAQLRRPSPKSDQRKEFEILIWKNQGDFEKTIKSVISHFRNKNRRRALLNHTRRMATKLFRIVIGN